MIIVRRAYWDSGHRCSPLPTTNSIRFMEWECFEGEKERHRISPCLEFDTFLCSFQRQNHSIKNQSGRQTPEVWRCPAWLTVPQFNCGLIIDWPWVSLYLMPLDCCVTSIEDRCPAVSLAFCERWIPELGLILRVQKKPNGLFLWYLTMWFISPKVIINGCLGSSIEIVLKEMLIDDPLWWFASYVVPKDIRSITRKRAVGFSWSRTVSQSPIHQSLCVAAEYKIDRSVWLV